jgi:hypothetical protein
MKVDTPTAAQGPQNEEVETQQEVQPKITEAALEINETTQNLEAPMQPDESKYHLRSTSRGDRCWRNK